jgi:hypothetical protein
MLIFFHRLTQILDSFFRHTPRRYGQLEYMDRSWKALRSDWQQRAYI